MTRPAARFAAAATALLALAGCSASKSGEQSTAGCEKFGVHAQNRWAPLGTAVREQPDVLAKKLEPGFAPNEIIAVDGWEHAGKPAYPDNAAPWNSDVWYRLANRAGWVTFAGVRGAATLPDPTGTSTDGGQPAPLPAECEL